MQSVWLWVIRSVRKHLEEQVAICQLFWNCCFFLLWNENTSENIFQDDLIPLSNNNLVMLKSVDYQWCLYMNRFSFSLKAMHCTLLVSFKIGAVKRFLLANRDYVQYIVYTGTNFLMYKVWWLRGATQIRQTFIPLCEKVVSNTAQNNSNQSSNFGCNWTSFHSTNKIINLKCRHIISFVSYFVHVF